MLLQYDIIYLHYFGQNRTIVICRFNFKMCQILNMTHTHILPATPLP